MIWIPITPDIEEGLIQKNVEKRQACLDKVSLIISEGVKTLHASGCNLIILPCNTLQDLFSSIVTQIGVDIFCREDQVAEEARRFFLLQTSVYQDLGFEKENIKIKLSLRPENRTGDNALWDSAEADISRHRMSLILFPM